jgi:hypothetical protein
MIDFSIAGKNPDYISATLIDICRKIFPLKTVLSPTKRKFYNTEKIDDIIASSFRDANDEICYLT